MKKFIDKNNLKKHEMIAGFTAQFIHSENMTISYWDVKKGSKLPEHDHPQEQISQVFEGEFVLIIDEERKIMTPGKVAIIPSGCAHSGEAITDCKIMDTFSPPRDDYKLN